MDISVNKTIPSLAPAPNNGKSLPVAEETQATLLPIQADLPEKVPPEEIDREPPRLSEETLEKLNEVLRERARELEFSVDDSSGRTIVRVIHSESGEVIRQLPPEVVLRFAEAFTKGTASLVEDFA